MTKNYGIDDGDGNSISVGLEEHNVWRVAQEAANRRGESVYVYPLVQGDAHVESTEVAPQSTPDRIEGLMQEAAQAGDQGQVAVCLVALGRPFDEGVSEDDALCNERRRVLEKLGIIPEHVGSDDLARAECIRVLS